MYNFFLSFSNVFACNLTLNTYYNKVSKFFRRNHRLSIDFYRIFEVKFSLIIRAIHTVAIQSSIVFLISDLNRITFFFIFKF